MLRWRLARPLLRLPPPPRAPGECHRSSESKSASDSAAAAGGLREGGGGSDNSPAGGGCPGHPSRSRATSLLARLARLPPSNTSPKPGAMGSALTTLALRRAPLSRLSPLERGAAGGVAGVGPDAKAAWLVAAGGPEGPLLMRAPPTPCCAKSGATAAATVLPPLPGASRRGAAQLERRSAPSAAIGVNTHVVSVALRCNADAREAQVDEEGGGGAPPSGGGGAPPSGVRGGRAARLAAEEGVAGEAP